MTQNQLGTKYKGTINLEHKSNPLVIAFHHITPNATVLDVGCACGDLGIVLKEQKTCEMFGLEYNPESVKIAMATGAYNEVHQFNLDELTETHFPNYHHKFDFIVCGDVLEHLRFPMDVLRTLKTYLKEGGYIIASIPNVAHMSIKSNLLVNNFTYTPVGLLDETHIHLFTYKSIAEGLSSIKLKIENCQFTMQPKNGLQPHDPYPLLPENIKAFIFYDWHSYVCQYVMKISTAEDMPSETLFSNNLSCLNISEFTAPDYIKNYRTQLLTEISLPQSQTQDKQLLLEKELASVAERRDTLRKKYKKYRRRATLFAIVAAVATLTLMAVLFFK